MKNTFKFAAALALTGCFFAATAQTTKPMPKEEKMETKKEEKMENKKMEAKGSEHHGKMHHGKMATKSKI